VPGFDGSRDLAQDNTIRDHGKGLDPELVPIPCGRFQDDDFGSQKRVQRVLSEDPFGMSECPKPSRGVLNLLQILLMPVNLWNDCIEMILSEGTQSTILSDDRPELVMQKIIKVSTNG